MKVSYIKSDLQIWRIDELMKLIYEKKLLINADYAYNGCFSSGKKMDIVESLVKDFPIGVFHLQRLDNNTFPNHLLLDGAQRLQAIIDVLIGNGFYFDMKSKLFTLDNTKFAHNTIVESLNGYAVSTEWKDAGATIEQAGTVQNAISEITSKEIFVVSYDCETDSHEVLKRINNCEKSYLKKKWYIGELQPINIERFVTKNDK